MPKKSLTPGKIRAIQRSSSASGTFKIIAVDHQDMLRQALRPSAPLSVTDDEMIRFKLDVTRSLSPAFSGILLDPLYGAAQAVMKGFLDDSALLVELEKADYQMLPLPLDVEIRPGWGVDKIKRMGGDGVKLFYYYNPSNGEHAARQDEVIRQIVKDCEHYDIPFYAEPIYYPHEGGMSKREAVIESARRAASIGADVLKLEFPVDVNIETDQKVWAEACAELTAAIDVPWVLLSAGVSFEMFARQLEIACKAGASGFIVGRALWGDVTNITDPPKRYAWLAHEGLRRLRLLGAITDLHARSWVEFYQRSTILTDWFSDYDGF